MSSIHTHGEALRHSNDAQEMTAWAKAHKVTKPMLGGRCPNRVKLMDGYTVERLAAVAGMKVKEFMEIYG